MELFRIYILFTWLALFFYVLISGVESISYAKIVCYLLSSLIGSFFLEKYFEERNK